MLVLAPAACIVGGIALSAAFETLTRSIKYAPAAPPALLLPAEKVKPFVYKYLASCFRDLLCNSFCKHRVIRRFILTYCNEVVALMFFLFTSFSWFVCSMEVKINS